MKSEYKVGLLFLVTALGVLLFAFMLGVVNPFSSAHELNLQFNFAGGIEVGSPVRVMGIKVGKVKSIEFKPEMRTQDGELVQLLVKISVSKRAWNTVKDDSFFYINLAGVIGEKFIEITPGTDRGQSLKPGGFVRGVDPPRIDQMISQGYGLAGKILALVEKNESTVIGTIDKLERLLTLMNETLSTVDRMTKNKKFEPLTQDIGVLVSDLREIVSEFKPLAKDLSSEESKRLYALVYKLIFRLEGLDKEAIKKFLQDEGIKARFL